MKKKHLLTLMLIMLSLLTFGTISVSAAETVNISTVSALQSAHPYSNNMEKTWVYTHPTSAGSLEITFSSNTETESNYDWIYVLDGSGNQIEKQSGTALAGKTITVPGNVVKIKLTSDGSVTKNGFTVTNIKANTSQSATIVARGTCGENLTWTLDSLGTLTISGQGDMTDFYSYSYMPWYSRMYDITKVVIKQGVTAIGQNAFCCCSNITSVTIPDSVTRIGSNAFSSCLYLTSITIPNSVKSIYSFAFLACSRLTSITIPDSVTYIGNEAFSSCSSLTSVTIGNGVTEINSDAFLGCVNLKRVYISDISAWCNISFSDNPLRYGGDLYLNNELVTDLIIPDNITEIKRNTFQNCNSLTSVTIPDSVTSISPTAFSGCNNLTSAILSETNENFSAVDGVIFNKDKTTLIVYLHGKKGGYIIPDSVKIIDDYAFSYCDSLTSITIPDSVTSIGDCAFYYCGSLTSITIPDSVTSIGELAFCYCDSLISITIPDSVTSIGDRAFRNNAYYNNSSNWENGVLYIGNHLIYAERTISGGYNIKEETVTIADYAFYDCTNLTSITVPDSVISIGDRAFYYCTNLTSITIPDSVTSIGERAFSACDNLTSITIPDSVTSIGEYVFFSCDNLTSVIIGSGVTDITSGAFYYCYNLKRITIPESVTNIGDWAFKNCRELTTVTYNGGSTDWDKISIGSDNFYLLQATKKFVPYVLLVDKDGNKISKKTYDINSFVDISDIDKNGYMIYLYTDNECKNRFDLTTPITKNLTLYVDFVKLNTLNFDGETSVNIGEKGITKKVSFGTDKETIYFACTISYPVDLILDEIKSDFFEIEYDRETIGETTYLYLTCIYNGNGNIPTYQEVSPFELKFSITENVQTGDVFTVEILESALIDNRGNVYQLENDEHSEIKINSIKVTKITITGAEEINCPTVYTAFVSPENATNKTILWSIDNEEIATISQDGVLTPLKRGTVVLKASAIDESEVYATKTISIVPGLAKVSDMTSNIGIWDKQYSNAENKYTIYVPKSATSIKLTAKHSGTLTSTSNQTFINNFPKTITLTFDETVLTLNYTCPDFEDNTYTITIKKFEGTKTEVSEDKKSFTIKPINVGNGKTVILALYNGEQFVEMQSAVYTGDAVPFTTTKTYTKAKVMVWDDLMNLKPVCEVETIE